MNFCTECGGKLMETDGPAPESGECDVLSEKVPKGKKTLKRVLLILALVGIGLYSLFNYVNNLATYLRVAPNELIASKSGGETKVKVDFDGVLWSVKECPDWVELETDGDHMGLKVLENGTGMDRSGRVVIKSGKLLAQVIVAQRGQATYLRTSEHQLHSSREGDSVDVKVETDGCDWQLQSSKFIVVQKIDAETLRIRIRENGGVSRKGYVVVKEDRAQSVITITQGGFCNYCNGMGQLLCPGCGGQGYAPPYVCYKCNNTGKVSCGYCGGSGVLE